MNINLDDVEVGDIYWFPMQPAQYRGSWVQIIEVSEPWGISITASRLGYSCVEVEINPTSAPLSRCFNSLLTDMCSL